jgi:TusA-related sulfurtransferase
MLAERIGEVEAGQAIEVLTDDPAAQYDLPAWCAQQSHELVGSTRRMVGWSFVIRRADTADSQGSDPARPRLNGRPGDDVAVPRSGPRPD